MLSIHNLFISEFLTLLDGFVRYAGFFSDEVTDGISSATPPLLIGRMNKIDKSRLPLCPTVNLASYITEWRETCQTYQIKL